MYQNPNTLYPQLNQALGQLQSFAQPQPFQQRIVEVSGRDGANAFQMGPDSSALLLDNTAPIVWVVRTDGAGYKTLAPFDITPHEEKKQEDVIKSLEERITKLEERLSNGKSNSQDAARRNNSSKSEQ